MTTATLLNLPVNQTEQVYMAEDEAFTDLCFEDWWPEVNLTPDEVPAFIEVVLRDAGWDVDEQPVIAFDVPDVHEKAGWVDPETDIIHLHPKLCSHTTVLHELAHWLAGYEGVSHGPRFCDYNLVLVNAALGQEAYAALRDSYSDYGVVVGGCRVGTTEHVLVGR